MTGEKLNPNQTIHASAVLVDAKAVLIRGASGAGKSTLAWQIILAAAQGALPFARLIGDDRVHVEVQAGRLLVRPAPELAGLIEIRGLGIRRLAYEPVAVVGLVVDLAADAVRYPGPDAGITAIDGGSLARFGVAGGQQALPMLLACLRTTPSCD
jgi:HPr kinase/phosphorylase